MQTPAMKTDHSEREGHAELPFRTSDPIYSDTWGVATVDPDSRQAYWAQVLCNAATGKARHLLMVISEGRSSCDYVYTDTPFHSAQMDVTLDGWRQYKIKSTPKNLELNAIAGHEPVDFAKLLTFKDFSLGHQEAGVRTTGHIQGRRFDGVGLRDRSFGHRPMTGVGCVTSVILVSLDLRASFAANLVHGSATGLGGQPDARFAFVNTPESTRFAKPEEIGVLRQSDGLVAGLRIGDHLVTVTDEIGHHHYTPHWYPAVDLSVGERRILTHVLRFVEGRHPVYGRVAGFVDLGVLAAS
jgi:hypothetical protein